jgi:hypothetical protein
LGRGKRREGEWAGEKRIEGSGLEERIGFPFSETFK